MPTRHHSEKNIDFEIGFYEGVLKLKPDFIQVLIALGELYTKKGLYDKGLEVDQKLSRLRPADPLVLYNLACSYALLNCVDESFRTMKRAIQNGYDDFKYLIQDKDLENLHKDLRFRRFLSRLAQNRTAGMQTPQEKSDAGQR